MDGLSPVVGSLIADGVVVRASSYHKVKDTDLSGDTSQIGKARERLQTYKPGDTFTLRKEYVPTIASSGNSRLTEIRKSSAAVSHGDFLKFINHSYLQFSTNVLHNEFCANGLDVMSGDGHAIFKVYGDNAMLNQAADEGVAYSGETSQRSFRAIKALATQPPMNLDPSLSLTAVSRHASRSRWCSTVQHSAWRTGTRKAASSTAIARASFFPGIASTWNAKSTVVGSGGTVGGVVSKDVGAPRRRHVLEALSRRRLFQALFLDLLDGVRGCHMKPDDRGDGGQVHLGDRDIGVEQVAYLTLRQASPSTSMLVLNRNSPSEKSSSKLPRRRP